MIPVKKLRPGAKLPTLGSSHSAGYDFYAALPYGGDPITLAPGGGRHAIPTGLAFALPSDMYLEIKARSGTAAKNGITELCGVIDSDYRGELMIVLVNTDPTLPFVVEDGQKIAQGVLRKYHHDEWSFVEELDSTERGEGGLGSTGQR